jgi:hypothetical protein
LRRTAGTHHLPRPLILLTLGVQADERSCGDGESERDEGLPGRAFHAESTERLTVMAGNRLRTTATCEAAIWPLPLVARA